MIASRHVVAIFSVKEFVWIEILNFLCSNVKNASMLEVRRISYIDRPVFLMQ